MYLKVEELIDLDFGQLLFSDLVSFVLSDQTKSIDLDFGQLSILSQLSTNNRILFKYLNNKNNIIRVKLKIHFNTASKHTIMPILFVIS